MSRPSGSVGVFDSGVGGLSVLRHVRELLPDEDLVYCADSLFAPYGGRSPEEICERSLVIAEFLHWQNCKALVIACNTATAAACGVLRQRYHIPVIGMEPAIKPAVAASRCGVVGVLATTGTLQSARFAALLDNYGRDVRVITQGCPGLVERVEEAHLDDATTHALVGEYVRPLRDAGADTLVLGCTHYPFLRAVIADIAGPGVTLVDTGAAVARQVRARLQQEDCFAPATGGGGRVKIFTNSPSPQATDVIARLWSGGAEIVQINSRTFL